MLKVSLLSMTFYFSLFSASFHHPTRIFSISSWVSCRSWSQYSLNFRFDQSPLPLPFGVSSLLPLSTREERNFRGLQKNSWLACGNNDDPSGPDNEQSMNVQLLMGQSRRRQ